MTALLSALAAAACAPEGNPQLAITDAWARPTLAAGQMSAAYLTVTNTGSGEDRLIAVASDVGQRATLHQSTSENGIARMRPLEDGLAIPANGSARLAPGGNHIMLEKLSRKLADGETIRIVLRFEKSGERPVQVAVRNGPGSSNHGGH